MFIHHANTFITLVLVYVDDLLISANCSSSIVSLKALLCKTFHMEDLGSLTYFLGMEIHRDESGIFMCQKKYTLDIIKECGISNARPVLLPMDNHIILTAETGDQLPDATIFQRLVGKFIY